MTKKDVLKRLRELIDIEFAMEDLSEEIICKFENFEDDNAEYGVIIEKSNVLGYDFIAYVNKEGSTEFHFCKTDIYDKNGYKTAVKITEIF